MGKIEKGYFQIWEETLEAMGKKLEIMVDRHKKWRCRTLEGKKTDKKGRVREKKMESEKILDLMTDRVKSCVEIVVKHRQMFTRFMWRCRPIFPVQELDRW